jgi:phospholipid/cholesterol/gamma-HCH transport system substrate-binding protein|tara:strand:+ start:1048 stop:2244 length:1197 start_codon:yes stop_codon:yes gene_type:complete
MNDKRNKLMVGLVMMLGIIVTSALVFIFGAMPSFGTAYHEMRIEFSSTPGVHENTTVQKNGVQIGRVLEINLQDTGVILTLAINKGVTLRYHDICRIKMGSLLTGEAILEFSAATPSERLGYFDANTDGLLDEQETKHSQAAVPPGSDLSMGTVVVDPLSALLAMQQNMTETFASIQRAGGGIDQAANEFTTLMKSLNSSFSDNESDLKKAVRKTEEAMTRFSTAMTAIDAIVGDPQVTAKLKQAVQQFPVILQQASDTMDSVQVTMKQFESVGEQAQVNLEHLQRFTQPLGERGEQLVESITSSVEDFDSLVTKMDQIVTTLNSSRGSLHKLIHDDELYDQIRRTSMNVEDATKRLRPIMNDLRIFTDKIATDPRQLGVSGALNRRPSGTGVKSPLR